MRCYYEVLGVPKNVDSSELKKAYYKLSLQWHPDKNAANEDTTSMFQQILEAYRVISDPQERAWYDSHRAEILQSGGTKVQMGATSQYEEERVDVFEYFTRSCFRGFDDGDEGFYTVYRKVFEQIAEEEIRAASLAGDLSNESSSDEASTDDMGKASRTYPSFGRSDSAFADLVSPFYQFWSVFQTRKNYTWVEKYDIRCAEFRAERRAMETENRQLRNAARKKRNEEIRQLVSYVKRRDKRVAAERERVQLVNQQAQVRSQLLAHQARQRDATLLEEAWNEQMNFGGIAAQWEEDFEAELARLEAEMDGVTTRDLKSDCDESLDDTESHQLYCVACDKAFASLKAKENHETSKRHRKQVELLRQVLLTEETEVSNLMNGTTVNGVDTDPSSSSENDMGPCEGNVKLTKRAKKAQRKRIKEAAKLQVAQGNPENGTGDVDPSSSEITQSPANQKSNQAPNASDEPEQAGPPAVCETCGVECSSRNQLFAHLKESGHARLKTVKLNQPKNKKKKRVR